ncbi:hypothetical protein HDU93_000169 [Gonapodya sp. JEL0774]|nr:hypothetical protein HDU93_000169 [Gonapodya sp. JEL0774]
MLKRTRRGTGSGEEITVEVVLEGMGCRLDTLEEAMHALNPLSTSRSTGASSSSTAALLARVRHLEAQNARLSAVAEGLWEAGVATVERGINNQPDSKPSRGAKAANGTRGRGGKSVPGGKWRGNGRSKSRATEKDVEMVEAEGEDDDADGGESVLSEESSE